MDIILLAKILAALEWQYISDKKVDILSYVEYAHREILEETQSEFNHLYLEL